jgi:hypothetical protein
MNVRKIFTSTSKLVDYLFSGYSHENNADKGIISIQQCKHEYHTIYIYVHGYPFISQVKVNYIIESCYRCNLQFANAAYGVKKQIETNHWYEDI